MGSVRNCLAKPVDAGVLHTLKHAAQKLYSFTDNGLERVKTVVNRVNAQLGSATQSAGTHTQVTSEAVSAADTTSSVSSDIVNLGEDDDEEEDNEDEDEDEDDDEDEDEDDDVEDDEEEEINGDDENNNSPDVTDVIDISELENADVDDESANDNKASQ